MAINPRVIQSCWLLLPFILMLGCTSERQMTNDDPAASNWKKIGPGGGGSTFIPTFSYNAPDKFILRCDMTGSYLTLNGGQSYKQINLPNGASSYAYDPLDKNTIYIGSVFLNKSTDGGKTWARIFPVANKILSETFNGDHATYSIETSDSLIYDRKNGHISFIRVDPMNSAFLYISMGSYFLYSADSGSSWQRKLLDAEVDFIYTNPDGLKNEALIFTPRSVYTFNKATHEVTQKRLPSAMSPAFSFTGGTVKHKGEILLYALHRDTTQAVVEEFAHTELWISKDKGEHWQALTDNTITNTAAGIKPSYSRVSCAEFDAENAYVIANRYEEKKGDVLSYWYGALKTSDEGTTWNWVWKGGGGSGRYGIKDGTGVSNLNDSWVEDAFGGEYIRLLDVGIYPKDGNVAVVTDWYRTMKTTDGGKTWNEVYSVAQPDSTFTSRGMDVTTSYGVHRDPFDNNHLAISYTDIGYHHSYNDGKSWRRSVKGIPSSWQNTCYWVLFDPDVKDKVWTGWSSMHDFPRGKMMRNPAWKQRAKGGICVSADGGKTWKKSNTGMGDDAPTTSIVIDRSSAPGNRTLYASVFTKGVFKSTDDGKNWTLKNAGIEIGAGAFELTIQNNGTLFLTVTPTPVHDDSNKEKKFFPGALYKSTDGAETWKKLDAGNVLFPSGIDYDSKNEDRIYLACWSDIMLSDLFDRRNVGINKPLDTDGGIFLSEDGGKTWEQVFDKDQYVYDVTVDAHHPGRIYCNTFNQGAFRSDDYGKTWQKIKGYDFHWGHRVIPDENDHEKVYLTTFGSSVWHGVPEVE